MPIITMPQNLHFVPIFKYAIPFFQCYFHTSIQFISAYFNSMYTSLNSFLPISIECTLRSIKCKLKSYFVQFRGRINLATRERLARFQREDELVRTESEVCGRSRCERKVETCETLIGRRQILTDQVGATS